MNHASISVIVRTVDRSRLLAEALESLARQTNRHFEAVVVDMGNGTAGSVLDGVRPRLPHAQHLLVGRLLLRPDALNYGIRRATADKIAILDDDNLFDPNHLQVLIDGLERTGADLVYTGANRTTYTPDGDLVDSTEWHHEFHLPTLLVGNYIHTCATAFWKRTWERVGGYDPRFPVGEDTDFLLKVAGIGTIESLPSVSAESRAFTGTPGERTHTAETDALRRCRAGLYWRHRKLFFRERHRLHAEKFGADGAIVPRAQRPAWVEWRRRASLLGDLLGWWWYCAPRGQSRFAGGDRPPTPGSAS